MSILKYFSLFSYEFCLPMPVVRFVLKVCLDSHDPHMPVHLIHRVTSHGIRENEVYQSEPCTKFVHIVVIVPRKEMKVMARAAEPPPQNCRHRLQLHSCLRG